MKAAIATAYGQPEVLDIQEVPRPVPEKNEVLVRVMATPATAADSMMRRGIPAYARLFLGLKRPKAAIPGTGFAGVVVAVGEAVKQFQQGDEVFGETGTEFGANAEYLTIPETGVLAVMPNTTSFEEAAPLTDGPLTVVNFLHEITELKEGQSVLVIGASGSLGTAAVQIAVSLGAMVTAVCSGANGELVRELGAGQVIDYRVTDYCKTDQRYDVIFDTVGKSSFPSCRNILVDDGVYLSPVLSMRLLAQMIGTSFFGGKKARFSATGLLPADKLRQLLVRVTDLIEAGQLKTIIDRAYPLDQIVNAHRHVDAGHKRGNVILIP